MAAMILLARILGKIEFGQIGVIQTTLAMVQTVAGFGFGWAATKYVAEFRVSDKKRAGRIIALCNLSAILAGALMALVFFLLAPWLATNALGASGLSRPLQISSLLLLVTILAGTQTGILAGFEAFKEIARINFLSGSLSLPMIIGGGWLFGVEGAIWGMIFGYALNWLLNNWNLRAVANRFGILIEQNECWQERRILWHFGIPVILASTLSSVAEWTCSVMLVNRPGGYGEMGYYSAANQWFAALIFLPGVMAQAAIPVLSEQIGKRDLIRTKKIFVYSVKLNLSLIIPTVLVGSLLSRWIMSFYGKDFAEAWPTLVFTLLAGGIVALQSPSGQIMMASGRMWMATIVNLNYSIVFIIMTVGLVKWGSIGVAASRTVAYCIYTLCSFIFALYFVSTRGKETARESAPSP